MMRGARVLRTKTLFSLMDPEGRASYKISLVLKKNFMHMLLRKSCFSTILFSLNLHANIGPLQCSLPPRNSHVEISMSLYLEIWLL